MSKPGNIMFSMDSGGLTEIEESILSSFATNMTEKQIADKHQMKFETLRAYKKKIIEKKNVGYIAELITYHGINY